MKEYMTQGIKTGLITFGVSVPVGWIDNVLSALIVAVFTFLILPLVEQGLIKAKAWLVSQGVSDSLAKTAIDSIKTYAIKQLQAKIKEAKRKNDLTSLDILSKELEKLMTKED